MNLSFAATKRVQSREEEIANSISHGFGLVAALVATPFLIRHAVRQGDAGFILGASGFAAAMVLLYLASTLFTPCRSAAPSVCFGSSSIPRSFFSSRELTPPLPWVSCGARGVGTLLGLIWSLAVAGVMLKALNRITHPVLTTSLYLLMGWLIVIAAQPLSARIPSSGLLWLVAGGLAYTVGVLFFAFDSRLLYGHFIWHLFVMAGTACHYFAVFWYAA